MNIYTFIGIGMLAVVAGCGSIPSSSVQHPTTARPPTPTGAPVANGAIFQAASYRPIFEDNRARLVGDTLTIVITEKTTASKADANSASKAGSVAMATPTLFGVPSSTTAKFGVSSTSATKFDEKAAGSASNNFISTITVTVVEVLSNGNLVVSGEKQVALDKGAEFVRFSGVVNPNTIVSGNTVSSTQVADARIEYRTNSQIDRAEATTMLTRFFRSILPL